MPLPDGNEEMWLRRFPTHPQIDVRLVCFPHAGGSASYYFALSQALNRELEVVAIQYPGRQERRREPLIDSISELSDRIFDVLSAEHHDRTAFFGHSMGAVVAFEVAQRFRRKLGTGPEWLFVSGRRAPSRHRPGTVHLCDDAGLVAELRTVGGTDPSFLADDELRQVILPVARNDFKAVETYTWTSGPPLDCPVTAFVGDHDPQTTVTDAAAWSGHTTGAFDLKVFPGGHFFLDTHRDAVARTIATAIGSSAPPTAIEEPAP